MAWLDKVQVNLPLMDLLGPRRALAVASPLNFEIGLDAAALDSLTGRQVDEAVVLLKGRRLTAHLPFMDLTPASVDPQVAAVAFKRFMKAADLALRLKAGQAVLHLGYDPRLHRQPEEFVRRLARSLAPMVGKLTKGGCRLVLENCFEPKPEVLLMARRALAEHGQVGFCLDVGHAMAFSETSLPDWWAGHVPASVGASPARQRRNGRPSPALRLGIGGLGFSGTGPQGAKTQARAHLGAAQGAPSLGLA